MSVTVRIDGRPAEQLHEYRAALGVLGLVPDESQHLFEIWTTPPQCRATTFSVWLNLEAHTAQEDWLRQGGAILESRSDSVETSAETMDRLRQGEHDIKVCSTAQTQLDPAVLAAFLTHDFPLADALILARAFRGCAWPDNLADFPVPVAGTKSDLAFAGFPRGAGLYVVVPTSKWVRRLADLGVPVVLSRDQRIDSAQTLQSIREAVQAVAGTNTRLFINDHWRLAIECGAYGVHLGQEDLNEADLGAIQKSGLRLGISTHGIYEMLRAHACRPSYMALGAIYATATKAMPTQPQGLRRLRHYVQLMSPHYPLVAIGGIDLSRIAGVLATGVDCAAVLRAIVEAPDYRRATLELLDMTTQPNYATGAV
jgi:thiamine-phosphate pyrophosphorylase